jgi:hypothetical protein
MSGLAKAVKKTFKAVGKLASKAVSVVKKVVKSKVFKVVVAAAAIYFGGAALMSMAGGGTASAGIGSAWGGLTGAGSAVAGGNFSGALSALSSGFTGGAAAGATGTFASGLASTQAAISGNAVAGAGALVGTAPSSGALTQTLNTGLMDGVGQAGLSNGALTAGAGSGTTTAGVTAGTNAATSGGLLSGAWNGLGEAGKAAVITSGVNMAGSMMQGKAEQEAAETARKRRTYWGVDGDGNTSQQPGVGLLNIQPYQPFTPSANNSGNWKQSLDDLINRTKQQGGY